MARESIERILVAADGTRSSLEAARYAASLARALKARVTLLHVVPIEPTPSGAIGLEPGRALEVEKALWEGAEAVLAGAREPLDEAGVPVEGLVRRGDAGGQIVEVARQEGVDLVVVAPHEGDGGGCATGSTGEVVLRDAPCPVLVVREGTT